MKVGILTQPLGHNYGGILQNWALHQLLKEMGHEPVTLTHVGRPKKERLLTGIRDTAAYIVKHIIFHPTRKYNLLPWDNGIYNNLYRFVKHHIKRTPYIDEFTPKQMERLGIEHIIVGSDQTWRPRYNNRLEVMYCDFLQPEETIKASAYAASFGVGVWEYSEGQTRMARHGIKNFNAISVRENSGVTLCRKYLNCDAVHVLDPTLLLSLKDYETLISEAKKTKVPEDYVGVYILDQDAQKITLVERVCQLLGMRPLYFGHPSYDGKYLRPVQHWLKAIKESSFMITDSFHGTVFSVNFHKPFMSIVNHERGADRFQSLLHSIGLEDRMVGVSGIQPIRDIINQQIDWETVENILRLQRIVSMKFLNESLKK